MEVPGEAASELEESSPYMRHVRKRAQEKRMLLGLPEPTVSKVLRSYPRLSSRMYRHFVPMWPSLSRSQALLPLKSVLTEADKDLIDCMQWCRGVLAASSAGPDPEDL
jgi:hypothetical protein